MRAAIIGIGAISPLHINAILSSRSEIVALCDIDTEKCFRAREKFELHCMIYEDYIEMLENEDIDVVHICTPHYLHAEMIVNALKKDINVLCEKPLAISEKQLENVKIALGRTKATLGVCHQTRYNETNKFVKEFLKNKKIVSACGTLAWQRDKEYYAQDKWRGKTTTEGGGVMINQALHTLDLLQWFCGMPISVIAHTFNDTLKGYIDVEETAVGVFDLGGGRNFIVSASNAAKHSFPVTIMLKTEEETIIIMDDNVFINGKRFEKSDGFPVLGKEVWGTGHIKIVKDFYDCIQSGKKFSIDFTEASKVIKLILGMYSSNGISSRLG